jgi:hypothetical protein
MCYHARWTTISVSSIITTVSTHDGSFRHSKKSVELERNNGQKGASHLQQQALSSHSFVRLFSLINKDKTRPGFFFFFFFGMQQYKNFTHIYGGLSGAKYQRCMSLYTCIILNLPMKTTIFSFSSKRKEVNDNMLSAHSLRIVYALCLFIFFSIKIG